MDLQRIEVDSDSKEYVGKRVHPQNAYSANEQLQELEEDMKKNPDQYTDVDAHYLLALAPL